MTDFSRLLSETIDSYVRLRVSLGYTFRKQASTLSSFARFVEKNGHDGPLTQEVALAFVLASGESAEGRACRYGVLRRFAEHLLVHDSRTEMLDPRALPRSRVPRPPRIPSDAELERLMTAARRISPRHPRRGQTLHTLVGLLASTGLRSGEALRLDRADVDLVDGVLHVRRTKFRKDRLVPIHPTTLDALRSYTRARDLAFPEPTSPAFFLSLRGRRLSYTALHVAFRQACSLAGLDEDSARALRPHDLRHRFAVERLAAWHREGTDVQALLPLLATYLGHVRYNDTAYYITGTAELLSLTAERAFDARGGAR
jgi:integrase